MVSSIPSEGDAALASMLATAAAECDRALVDDQAGLLDERELRRELLRIGLVVTTDEAFLLDLETHRWWRYDGVEVRPAVR